MRKTFDYLKISSPFNFNFQLEGGGRIGEGVNLKPVKRIEIKRQRSSESSSEISVSV